MGLAEKYFEGWQVGALTVLFAWSAALVIVPRSVAPDGEVPPPQIAASEVDLARQKVRSEQGAAKTLVLEGNVALLDARLRAFGRAEAAADERELSHARALVDEVNAALPVSTAAQVRALRARHGAGFVRAFAEYRQNGQESDALRELGGDAVHVFEQNGWLDEPLVEDFDVVLATLHRKRFNALLPQLIDASDDEPDLISQRILLRFLMAHPPRRGADKDAEPGKVEANFILARVDELAVLEPSYPVQYAKGILYYRLGRFEVAAQAFDMFLLGHPDGPYRLRAVNHLKAALENGDSAR